MSNMKSSEIDLLYTDFYLFFLMYYYLDIFIRYFFSFIIIINFVYKFYDMKWIEINILWKIKCIQS